MDPGGILGKSNHETHGTCLLRSLADRHEARSIVSHYTQTLQFLQSCIAAKYGFRLAHDTWRMVDGLRARKRICDPPSGLHFPSPTALSPIHLADWL